MTGHRVTDLQVADGQVCGVKLGNMTIESSRVLIAASPWGCARLIRFIEELGPLFNKLVLFDYQPIATVFLEYEKPVLLKPTMLGLADNTTQWLFDRRITSHPKIISAVISADGEHTSMSKEELTRLVVEDIKANTPLKLDPVNSMVIREKRATFSATPEIETLRPANQTTLRGCWIAGDYTNTGYPATLEGAIISGKAAADSIINQE